MTRPQTVAAQIRWMIRRDMPEVLDIEQQSFEFAWTEEDFLCCLRQRNCIGMVAEHQERIVAFMVYELLKNQLHVLNFAVCPSMHRKGIGSQMVDKLKNKLAQQKRTEIRFDVEDSNLSMQLFLKSHGFAAAKILPGHYERPSGDVDAYMMLHRKRLPVADLRQPQNRISEYFHD